MAMTNESTARMPPMATADTAAARIDTDLRGTRSIIHSAVSVPRNVPAPATPKTAA